MAEPRASPRFCVFEGRCGGGVEGSSALVCFSAQSRAERWPGPSPRVSFHAIWWRGGGLGADASPRLGVFLCLIWSRVVDRVECSTFVPRVHSRDSGPTASAGPDASPRSGVFLQPIRSRVVAPGPNASLPSHVFLHVMWRRCGGPGPNAPPRSGVFLHAISGSRASGGRMLHRVQACSSPRSKPVARAGVESSTSFPRVPPLPSRVFLHFAPRLRSAGVWAALSGAVG